MILDVIIFKNERVHAFTNPQFIDTEPEKAALQLKRSMIANPEKAAPYQNLTMWYFGTFNDETGEWIKPEDGIYQLLDCRIVWEDLKSEFLSKNGQDDKN